MTLVNKFTEGAVQLTCPRCEEVFTYEVPSNFKPKYVEEFDQYENLVVKCPICEERDGFYTHVVINLNLPESEFDEVEIEPEMPFEEINARKYVRDIMWAFRPDLRKEDRKVFNEQRKQELREELEKAREKIGEFIGGIGDKIDEVTEPKGDDTGKNIKDRIEELLGRDKR